MRYLPGDSLQTVRDAGRGANFESWLAYQRQAEALPVLEQNNAIVTSNICAVNQKMVNEVLLSYMLWEDNTLSETVLQQVKAVADQCPMDGGFAVYEARTIYRRFVPSATWDISQECAQNRPNDRSATTGLTISDYVLSPNPANNWLMVSRKPSSAEAAVIELYNPYGKLAKRSDFPATSSSITIDTQNLPSGMYFYKIASQGKLLDNGKVMITH